MRSSLGWILNLLAKWWEVVSRANIYEARTVRWGLLSSFYIWGNWGPGWLLWYVPSVAHTNVGHRLIFFNDYSFICTVSYLYFVMILGSIWEKQHKLFRKWVNLKRTGCIQVQQEIMRGRVAPRVGGQAGLGKSFLWGSCLYERFESSSNQCFSTVLVAQSRPIPQKNKKPVLAIKEQSAHQEAGTL